MHCKYTAKNCKLLNATNLFFFVLCKKIVRPGNLILCNLYFNIKKNMVYTCCVPRCKTGYRSCRSKENIAMFQFSSDQEICHLWLNAMD